MALKPFVAVMLMLAVILAVTFAQTSIPIPLNQWTEPYDVQGKTFGPYLEVTIPGRIQYREIVIKMQPIDSSSSFDPDLYVKFDEIPTRTSYDKSDTTINQEHVVTLTKSQQHPMTTGTKVYIGVYAYSTTAGKFRIYAEMHGCIFANCGGETRGTCDPLDGKCHCNSGFQTVEYCRAEDKELKPGTAISNTLLMNQISYYNITFPPKNAKAWFEISLVRTSTETEGSAELVLRRNGIPTTQIYDLRSSMGNQITSIALLVDDREYLAGKWTVGVINNSKGPFGYTLNSTVMYCKNDCSHHGQCDVQTSVCTCDPNYSIHPEDCSIRSEVLELAAPQYINPEPWSQTYFSIPVHKHIAEAALELGVHLELFSESQPPAGTTWPTMYISLDNKRPTTASYDLASPQPSTWNQTLYVPDSKLAEGTMNILIVNQNARDLTYVVSLVSRPHCPSGCIKNGFCSPVATCMCQEGFIGGSCDVTQKDCNQIRGIKTTISYGAAVAVFFIALALAAAISAFIYAKFFYISPQTTAVPDMQYDPLAA